MIQAISAAVVLIAPEVLWVIDVRVVVESLPILVAEGLTPRATIGLLSACGIGLSPAADESCGATGRQ